MHRGELVIRYQAGSCRFTEEECEISDDTVFTIASITKVLTATCVMQCVEEGMFALQDPAARFLPKFGRSGKEKVTFFHLLTHTSGLPEQVEGKDELRRRQGSLEEFNERICEQPLLFAPGTDYLYSSCGISILARTVEELEGSPFGKILEKRIFKPLGMRSSVLGAEPSWDDRIAAIELPPGRKEARSFVNSRYWRSMGAPWGAMISNTEDLAAFAITKGLIIEAALSSFNPNLLFRTERT